MLKLRTFGTIDLRRSDGERLDALLDQPKRLALLLVLAAHQRDGPVRREKVVSLLWPESSPSSAREALSTTLSRLRAALGEDVLQGRGTETIGLSGEHFRSDVAAFQSAVEEGRYRDAADLYQGPFLEGFRPPNVRPFEKWMDAERTRLARSYREALETLAERAERRGEPQTAAGWWRERVNEDPYDSRVARRLMKALVAAGNPAEALRVARTHTRLVRKELGTEPSPEVRELAERIEAGEAEGGSAETAEAAPTGPAGEGETVRPGAPERLAGAQKNEHATPRELDQETADTSGPDRLVRPGPLVGLVLLLGGAVGAWYLLAPRGEAAPGAGDRSVAVLPFEAIGTENPAPIAEGLHSDLLTRLSRVGDLDVISATSVEGFRDTDLPLPAIADSLDVKWIIEGEVQRAGDAIQVNAQLVDPRTDTHAWADTYRRELTAENLFDLQADITRRITGVLQARMSAEEEDRLDRQATGSMEAYRFYVRGRGLLEQRKPSDIRRALDYFDQAVAEDSAFALAWAGRADALAILSRFPETTLDTLLPRASKAADRALSLDPDLAEAYVASGRLHMYRRDARAALRAFEQAVALRPSYAAAHAWLAKLELSIGRPEKALEDAKRAVELNPLSPENLGTLTIACHANDRVHRVLEIARRIRRLTGQPAGHEPVALAHLSRLEELRRQWRERGLSIYEQPLLALYVTEAGGSAPVEEALRTAEAQGNPRNVALLHAVLGDEDRALEILDGLYPRDEIPWDLDFTVFLRYDSYWPESLGPLREHPRYHALMRKINLHWGLNPDGSLPDSVDVAFDAPTDEGVTRLPRFRRFLRG